MKLLEKIILQQNLVESRKRALFLIKNGYVSVNNQVITDRLALFNDDVNIKINLKPEYVSKGAYKLEAALNAFNIDVNGKTVLDIEIGRAHV